MHGLPIVAHAFEDERHATRSGVGLAFVSLRLRPKTGHHGAIGSQHNHVTVAHVQLHVFDVGIRGLAILAHLVPTLSDRSVVVEENQRGVIPIPSGNQVDVRAPDAFDNFVKGANHRC